MSVTKRDIDRHLGPNGTESEQGSRTAPKGALNRAQAEKPTWRGAGRQASRLVLRQVSTVAARPVRWLWEPRIPLGKLSILAGAAGQAKSLTTLFLAAGVTRGTLPGDLKQAPSGVIIVSAEDDPEDTIKPRLVVAGADPDLVHFADMRDEDSVASTISLPCDAPAIREAVADHDVKLVILDPISGLLDDEHSSWSGQQVRRALAPMKSLAEDHGVAILAVMHPNKGSSTNALARIADSGAFTQLARSVLFQGADPADPEADRGRHKVLALPKSNIAPSGEHALSLYIESVPLDINGEGTEQPRVVLAGSSEATAADVLAASEHGTALAEARQFLRDELASGPRPASEIQAAAREADIAERTLRRAREIDCKRPSKEHSADGQWMWELKVPKPAGSFQLGHLGHLGSSTKDVQGGQGAETHETGHLPLHATATNEVARDDDPELAARADAYQEQFEAEGEAA